MIFFKARNRASLDSLTKRLEQCRMSAGRLGMRISNYNFDSSFESVDERKRSLNLPTAVRYSSLGSSLSSLSPDEEVPRIAPRRLSEQHSNNTRAASKTRTRSLQTKVVQHTSKLISL